MRSLLLLVCFVLGLRSFAQNLSWYRMLRGKIDKYPVTLHLHKAGHDYQGYYYYDAYQQPFYFSGEDSTHKDSIRLTCFTPGEDVEYFAFTLSGNAVTGTWKKNQQAKPLSFTATEEPMPPVFSYVFSQGSSRLRPRLKSSPEATFGYASVWPTGKTAAEDSLKKIIRSMFVLDYRGAEEIGQLFLREKKKFFADYAKAYADVKDADLKDMNMAYSMEAYNRLLIAFRTPGMATLAFWNYSYTGGAHGNYGTSYCTVNLATGKKLGLNELLIPSGMKKLQGLLERNFRKQYKVKDTDPLTEGGLFENKIEPNDNFFVTGKGVGFAYNPYEIGPYVLGEIEIFIPFKELELYLRPEFRKQIQN